MADTTKMIENKIEKAKNTEEFMEVIRNLPKITFYDRMDELVKKYKTSYSQIQKATCITKSLFYRITSPIGKRKPQKHQIIKISLAMGLTVEEVNELLKLANHKELYAKNKEDAIIIYGITNNLRDIEIEELLIDAGATFSLIEE